MRVCGYDWFNWIAEKLSQKWFSKSGFFHLFDSAIANYFAINLVSRFVHYTTPRLMSISNPSGYKQLAESCLFESELFLPHLIGRLYTDKLFVKESIQDLKWLITNLKEAFNQLLDESVWLDADTKTRAKEKLNAISVNVALPEFLLDDNLLNEYHNQVIIQLMSIFCIHILLLKYSLILILRGSHKKKSFNFKVQ